LSSQHGDYDRPVLPLRDNVPTRSFPLVTVALIAANVAVWVLYQLPNLDRSVTDLGYHPCEVVGECPAVSDGWLLTVLTSMFLHGSWTHLLGNMLFLWIFGNNVEDSMGRLRYLVFYVVAGVVATAAQSVVTLGLASDADARIANVGASGAIAGVLGAYFVLLPHARVLTLLGFFVIEVPALVVLGLWFVFQLWSGSASFAHPEQGGGVAFFAHIGGFVFGLVAVNGFAVRRPVATRLR
jgi:membrane associated rhomboid family serine protease